jgi:hypothetical protein
VFFCQGPCGPTLSSGAWGDTRAPCAVLCELGTAATALGLLSSLRVAVMTPTLALIKAVVAPEGWE